jgi:hypothetical protein
MSEPTTLTGLQQRAIARLHPLVTVDKTPVAIEKLELAAFGLALEYVPNLPGKSLPPTFALTNLLLLADIGIEVALQDHHAFALQMCGPDN